MKWQSTHWYRGRVGYTSDPTQTTAAEIEKVGWHDCSLFGCEETHRGSAEDSAWFFIYAEIRAAEVTRKT